MTWTIYHPDLEPGEFCRLYATYGPISAELWAMPRSASERKNGRNVTVTDGSWEGRIKHTGHPKLVVHIDYYNPGAVAALSPLLRTLDLRLSRKGVDVHALVLEAIDAIDIHEWERAVACGRRAA